jgi:diaminohydroxyphosphoribosylaminopyrimidine deaminase/5-amino-6-(5-phosphoribosylamino)uracil reductase
MTEQAAEHTMQLAIDLAARGLYSTSPNPRVGCVLVKDGVIIGQGFHRRAGEAHAEVNAITDAGDATGATAYVTLEPCSHTGKTPPCCEALIAAGVAKVVVAMTDPNPLVSGSGIARLRQAGIDVEVGVLEQAARELNPGFIKRMQTGLPWVRVKLAMSLDGRTAMASGESQWITGAEARSDVQRLRARSCAIISGVDTVITDQASLTVRADELAVDAELAQLAVASQPLRVVLDSRLRLPSSANILSQPGRTLLVAAAPNPLAEQALQAAGAEVIYCPDGNGRVNLPQLLHRLAEREINEIMVEAGATLAGAFTEQGLVDQYAVYMAPTLLGSAARPLLELPLDTMAQQRRLQIESITAVGEDWRIDARPVPTE